MLAAEPSILFHLKRVAFPFLFWPVTFESSRMRSMRVGNAARRRSNSAQHLCVERQRTNPFAKSVPIEPLALTQIGR